MSDDLAFAIVSFLLYGGGFAALIYIGKRHPSWRLELVGVFVVVGSRVALYLAAMLFYSQSVVQPSPNFLAWLSKMSSLMMGIILNIYLWLTIARISNE